jgi:hypothetical protein
MKFKIEPMKNTNIQDIIDFIDKMKSEADNDSAFNNLFLDYIANKRDIDFLITSPDAKADNFLTKRIMKIFLAKGFRESKLDVKIR